MKHWTSSYIGIPFLPGGRDAKGLDCFGLLRLCFLEQRKIELSDLPNLNPCDTLSVSHEIASQIKGEWREVARPFEFCAVAMSMREVFHHVGIWTEADGGKVIHSWRGPVVADTIRSLRFKGIRTIKFFEYGLHH